MSGAMREDSQRRLDQLLSAYKNGIFNEAELATQFGYLAETADIGDLLNRTPSELHDGIKAGIAAGNRQAADDERLLPEDSPFDQTDEPFGSYYRNVANILLAGQQFKRYSLASVVCLPSFEVEWAIVLFGSRDDEYCLSLTVADAKIWSSQAPSSVTANRRETLFPFDLAKKVCEVWQWMLRRVRHSECGSVGLDGVNYHFASYGRFGQMAGKVWSPDPDTLPGRLVRLSHLLYRYVELGTSDSTDLLSEISQMIDSFKRRE
jgi:hypothetical protein